MAADWGWKAHVHEGPDDWAAGTVRVTLYRRDAEGGEQIVGFDDAAFPITERVIQHAMPKPGFRIPREAVEALAEVVKPGPSQGEVRRLEEALAIERARVDRALRGYDVDEAP